jgi:phage/plasmid primase-like uncharacterized protein
MSRPDFYGELTPGEHELLADVTEIAAERDQYAAEAAGLRERLAEALAGQTQLATLVSDLRAQLHAAGLEPVGQRWARIGVAA